jgi:hypothetical protein
MYQTFTSQLSNQSRLLGPWCNMNNQKVNSVDSGYEHVAFRLLVDVTFQMCYSEHRKFRQYV